MTLSDLDTRTNNITLMRLIAAWMVLYSHSWSLLGFKKISDFSMIDRISYSIMPFSMKLSGVAVCCFFCLSGFLITKSFIRGKSPIHYAVSRFLRIYPALWANLLFCVFVIGLLVTPLDLYDKNHLSKMFIFLKDNSIMLNTNFRLIGNAEIFPGNPNPFGINGSLWTLPAEIRAYLLVFIFGILGVFSNKYIFALSICCLLLLYFYGGSSIVMAKPGHTRLMLFFLIGVLFYIYKEKITINFITFFSLLLISCLSKDTIFYEIIASVCLCYFIIILAYHPKLQLPPIDKYGDYSYGIYLYAFPVQQSIVYYMRDIHVAELIIYTTFLSFFLSYLSWHLIEKRCLALKMPILNLIFKQK